MPSRGPPRGIFLLLSRLCSQAGRAVRLESPPRLAASVASSAAPADGPTRARVAQPRSGAARRAAPPLCLRAAPLGRPRRSGLCLLSPCRAQRPPRLSAATAVHCPACPPWPPAQLPGSEMGACRVRGWVSPGPGGHVCQEEHRSCGLCGAGSSIIDSRAIFRLLPAAACVWQ